MSLTLGVLSDTHIPDRARELDPQVGEIFRGAAVRAILHAGDVSTPAVLERLAQIAPVYAVRGNRDWVALRHLPTLLRLTFDGVEIGLAHGHGRWWEYWGDKPVYLVKGFEMKRFYPRLAAAFPTAKALVFGHVHRPVNEMVAGRLVFNPGTVCCPDGDGIPRSVGLLHIEAGSVYGEVIYL